MLKNKKLLIFGGGFDPVHRGHIKLLKSAINKIKPNLTLIIPNKFKTLSDHKEFFSSQKHRINMCKLAFSDIKNLKICNYEINQTDDSPSYTYKTIKYLAQKYPNYEIFLLIGNDRLDDFQKWKDYVFNLAYATLVVGSRNDKKITNKFWLIDLNIKPINISSSQLREQPDKKYLTKPIVNYIRDHGLYALNQIKPLLDDYRFNHTLRVTNTALEIANAVKYKNLTKVYLAAMYHDVAKNFSGNKILNLVGEYDKKHFPTIHALHGVASSKYIKKYFNINDKEILSAIANHVIPRSNCSKLAKILYCADKLEPNRTKKDVSNRVLLLKKVKQNLNNGFKILYDEIKRKY